LLDEGICGWVLEVVGFDERENEIFLLVVVDEVGVCAVVPDHGLDVFDVELNCSKVSAVVASRLP
jgi:hypothetical protein